MVDFTYTEAHTTVRELAGRILGDAARPERLVRLDEWFDRRTWSSLAEAGLLGVALPERDGGAGLGFFGAHLLLEQAGAAAAQLPLWETIVLGALPVATFGDDAQRSRLLPGVVAGELVLTAALTEEGAGVAREPRTRADRSGDGWELTGVKSMVPVAAEAAAILVPATADDGGVGVWLVEPAAAGVTVRAQDVMSGQPHAEVSLERVQVGRGALLGRPDGRVLGWLLEHATAGLASMAAGVCAAALRLTADHASAREQFGRPIGAFQAVAQRAADAYIDVEAVQLTALQAAWRLSEGVTATDEVAIAKFWAAEAGHRVLHAAHHLHGGIGVDREYPLHRFFALAKQIEFTLGSAVDQLRSLGASMAAEPA